MQREGYARIILDGKTTAEAATCTCGHCQRIVHMHDRAGKAKQGVLVLCHQCGQKTCVPCAETGKCTPFEKKLEQLEASARLRAQIGTP